MWASSADVIEHSEIVQVSTTGRPDDQPKVRERDDGDLSAQGVGLSESTQIPDSAKGTGVHGGRSDAGSGVSVVDADFHSEQV